MGGFKGDQLLHTSSCFLTCSILMVCETCNVCAKNLIWATVCWSTAVRRTQKDAVLDLFTSINSMSELKLNPLMVLVNNWQMTELHSDPVKNAVALLVPQSSIGESGSSSSTFAQIPTVNTCSNNEATANMSELMRRPVWSEPDPDRWLRLRR